MRSRYFKKNLFAVRRMGSISITVAGAFLHPMAILVAPPRSNTPSKSHKTRFLHNPPNFLASSSKASAKLQVGPT